MEKALSINRNLRFEIWHIFCLNTIEIMLSIKNKLQNEGFLVLKCYWLPNKLKALFKTFQLKHLKCQMSQILHHQRLMENLFTVFWDSTFNIEGTCTFLPEIFHQRIIDRRTSLKSGKNYNIFFRLIPGRRISFFLLGSDQSAHDVF